jgi:hypothetical protein
MTQSGYTQVKRFRVCKKLHMDDDKKFQNRVSYTFDVHRLPSENQNGKDLVRRTLPEALKLKWDHVL